MHGKKDTLINIRHARLLHGCTRLAVPPLYLDGACAPLAAGACERVLCADAGHNDMHTHKDYNTRMLHFIKHELPYWCANGSLPPPVAADVVKRVRVNSVHDVPDT